MKSRAAAIRAELNECLAGMGWKAADDSFYGSVVPDLVMQRDDDVYFVMDVRDERNYVHFASIVETASHREAMKPTFEGRRNFVLLTTGRTTDELSQLASELHVRLISVPLPGTAGDTARSFAAALKGFDPLAEGDPDRPWALAPPFDQATPDDVGQLALHTSFEHYSRGDLIYDYGTRPDALYIVTRGTVELLEPDENGVARKPLSRRGSLSVFGEMAILDGAPRIVAAQVSSKEADVWRTDASAFIRLVRSNPAVREALHGVLAQITRSQASYRHDCGFRLLQAMAAAMRGANECRLEERARGDARLTV